MTHPLSDTETKVTFCEYCGGNCLGHKKQGYNPADHFTVKGWQELGKILTKERLTNTTEEG